MFSKKDTRPADDFRKNALTYPEIIEITAKCIEVGLANYVEKLRGDIELIPNECGIRWEEKDINENVEILFNVCLFFAPPFATQTFNDETIAQKYYTIFTQSMKDRWEAFKYFAELSEKHKTPPMGLFPFLLALKYRPSFERLLKSVKATEISARAISFTNDFASAFCKNNPVIEGFLGDSIARATIQK